MELRPRRLPVHRDAVDAGDERTGLCPLLADADRVGVSRNAHVADVDVVAAGGEIGAGVIAQRDVIAAGCVAKSAF